MQASSVIEFMRDPLDLCFQPAFALTPDLTTDDGCDVGHRFADGNCRLVIHERADDRGDQLDASVLLRRVTRSTMSFCAARSMTSLPFAVPVPVQSYGRNLWMRPWHESAAYLPP
jgi:hypothetical protein